MIKVIKPGYRKEVECLKCGALLSYDEKEDIQKETLKTVVSTLDAEKTPMYVSKKYIICPQCKNKIVLNSGEIIARGEMIK